MVTFVSAFQNRLLVKYAINVPQNLIIKEYILLLYWKFKFFYEWSSIIKAQSKLYLLGLATACSPLLKIIFLWKNNSLKANLSWSSFSTYISM